MKGFTLTRIKNQVRFFIMPDEVKEHEALQKACDYAYDHHNKSYSHAGQPETHPDATSATA